jgi:phage-related protein
MADRTVRAVITGSSAGAVRAFEESALAAEAAGKTIGDRVDAASTKAAGGFSKIGNSIQNLTGIPVGGVFDKISSKFDEASTKGQKFGATLQTLGGATALGAAAGIGVIAVASFKAADEFEAAQSSMNTAIKNAGGNVDVLRPKVEAAYGAMAKFGFNSTDTARALTTLTTATHNPTQAIGLLQTAADLARLKHIGLTDASQVLAKAFAGSTRALTQMGINLDVGSGKLTAIHKASDALSTAQENLRLTQEKVALGGLKGVAAYVAIEKAQAAVSKASDTLNKDQSATGKIIDAVNQKTHGAADAYGHTLAGQMAAARAQVHNLETEFGEKLVPVLSKVLSIVATVTSFLLTHKVALIAVSAVVGGIMVAAFGAWAASILIVDGALAPLVVPILAVIAVVAALAVVVYEVISHWSDITGFFRKLWHDVQSIFDQVVTAVTNIIRGWYPLILGVLSGGILLIPALIYKYWDQIRTIASNVISDTVGFFASLPGQVLGAIESLSGIWGWFQTNVYDPIVNGFKALPGDVGQAIESGVSALANFGKDIINGIISGINAGIDAINSHIPSVFGVKILPSIPDIPKLAEGGVVKATPGGVLALLGEGGRDEAVVPLGKGGALSGGGVTLNAVINVANPNANGQEIVNALRNWIQRNGSLLNAGVA